MAVLRLIWTILSWAHPLYFGATKAPSSRLQKLRYSQGYPGDEPHGGVDI
jgi:hypothetical protein